MIITGGKWSFYTRYNNHGAKLNIDGKLYLDLVGITLGLCLPMTRSSLFNMSRHLKCDRT